VELIPAIDLLDGSVVRLERGDYARKTEYSDDPVAQAVRFFEAGARRLHVVDLEGARSGEPAHLEPIRAILAATELEVQVGGGIRSREAAERWLAAGASRVVLGTIAVKDPGLAQGLCEAHPGRVIIAIDARGDDVAVEGWKEQTGEAVGALADRAVRWGAAALLYTDIERDGTSAGPATQRTAALTRRVPIEVIASGGIGALHHLAELREAGVPAAVCGRALYAGAFTLEDGLAVADGRAAGDGEGS
jgi:phosphoribosylformimino-5-aminoimidazole carboxamide ribotide isomerase